MVKVRLLEFTAESAEIVFKQVIEDSVIKDIPIIGTLAKLCGIGLSIRDRLYTDKIRQFLIAIDEIPEDKRLQFRDAVASGHEECELLVQKILLVIESQSDVEKSELIANLFLAYLDGVIAEADFRRALDVTANYFLDDLKEFLKGDASRGFMRESYEDLESNGLANLVGSPLIGFDKSTPRDLEHLGWPSNSNTVLFESTSFGGVFKRAYHHGEKLRRKS